MKKVLTLLLACLLNGIVLANHWEPCAPGLYSGTNANFVVAFLDGVELQSLNLEVAMFCGDECRGTAMADLFVTGRYTFYINTYGEEGHVMYFKLYDHDTGIEYEQDPSTEPVIWVEDGVGELPLAPYPVYFVSPVQQFTITAEANPEEGGIVEGAGTYDENTECTLTATANEGYNFTNWTENDEVVSTEAEYTFTVTGDRDLVANFEEQISLVNHFVTEGNWSDASNWSGNALPGIYDEAFIDANCLLDMDAEVANLTITDGVTLTLQSGNVLTVTGSLTNTEVESLVIKDGAQLLINSSLAEAYMDFSQQGYSNGQSIDGQVIALDNIVSIVFNKGNGTTEPKYYSTGTAVRAYAKNNFVVSSSAIIKSIELTFGTNDGTNAISTNVGTFSYNTWSGSSSAVTFTIGGSSGNRRIKAVAVTYSFGEVMATVEKNIIGYEGESGWYTIASPVNEMEIEESDFLTPEYDLYRYNEGRLGEEWENYKDEENDFTTFENGRGYLYANTNTFAPTFVGALNSSDVTTYLMYTERPDQLSGFNLIGNPFPHVIYKGNGGAIDDENLASGFYTLTNEGAWHVCTYQDAIMPGQGVLVKTIDEMDLTISKTNARANGEAGTGNAKSAMPSMSIKVAGEPGVDRAVIYFGQGINLDKIDNPRENTPMLYIHNEDGNYAIAHYGQDAEVVDLMFQNTVPSTFTLSVSAGDTNFSYLHLIDHITGSDVDLLQQPNYTFQATGNEYLSRFMLVFKIETSIGEQLTESFCFAKDGVLYIVTDTESVNVALVDVLGRTVKQANATHIDITDLKAGVYVVRMDNGSEVNVQKIIIK